MKNSLLFFSAVVAVASAAQIEPPENSEIVRQEPKKFAEKIQYYYYRDNKVVLVSDGHNFDKLEDFGYKAGDNITVIMHGWMESCKVKWVKPLIAQFTKHRGGIVICVDYSHYSINLVYSKLVEKFEPIRNVMTDKNKDLANQNVLLQFLLLLWGFSFGGQLATGIGYQLTPKIKYIHTCDMAGIGFDKEQGPIDHRGAAEYVYCVHTSSQIGTEYYNCHQNFRMGNCGLSQPGIGIPLITSHLLCVDQYISAFDNPFYAIPKPKKCKSDNAATYIPEGYKMGFMEPRLTEGRGEYFAETRPIAPYNVVRS